ncbi:hypothetical protein CKW00_03825 [Salimicrobium humidisoli]|uniref:SIR2-like domain-containing protein n=1 Tax=Salimicrobium humidisoli TaxID=2029857 RepID=A0ABX4HTA7_9BACI|nr:hypothetical protein CKW00_03825 [Salimicrobium humidisoli]
MNKLSYEPSWPDNMLFVGAGASLPLGFSTTDNLGNMISSLVEEEELSTEECVNKAIKDHSEEIKKEWVDLLNMLDSRNQDKRAERERLGISEERYNELCSIYDWRALKALVRLCPKVEGMLKLQDLFNLIDLSISANQGVFVGDDFVRPEQLHPARNMLILLITMIHKMEYDQAVKNNKETYQQFYQFSLVLGELMWEEGLDLAKEHSLNTRDFYLFSYSVVSMNWDPMILWFLFNAHYKLNNPSSAPGVGNPPQKMKLFHDLAHFMGVRSIDTPTLSLWYPMNETAVQRLNDPEHQTGRRVRIGKFYFPHGSHGFRECPYCGKLTFYLGDQWKVLSDDLFPPSIIPSLGYTDKAKSAGEEKAYGSLGKFDMIQCIYCGAETEAQHTPLVMQTNYKGQHPPYIEEIQRDMNVAVSEAKHIILFGYSLPSDDVHYRSVLTAKKKKGVKCSIVNFDPDGEDRWLDGEELEAFLKDHPSSGCTDVGESAIELFGRKNVRAYLKGIPNVFMENGAVSKEKVKKMLRYE